MFTKTLLTLALVGCATAASSPEIEAICQKYQGTVNGTMASDNFMRGCTEQLLVKDSPITDKKQCTKGKAILSAFESTTCKPSNGADDDDHCTCSTMSAVGCAAGVAGCAAACVASFGAACVACVVGLGPECCQCACDAFGCDCSSDC